MSDRRPELEVRRRVRRRVRADREGPPAVARARHRAGLARGRRAARGDRRRRPGRSIIEIGTGVGVSGLWMLQAVPRARCSRRSTPRTSTSSTRDEHFADAGIAAGAGAAHRRTRERGAAAHERELLRHRLHRRRCPVGDRVRRARPAPGEARRHRARRARALEGPRRRSPSATRASASARSPATSATLLATAISPAVDGLLQIVNGRARPMRGDRPVCQTREAGRLTQAGFTTPPRTS